MKKFINIALCLSVISGVIPMGANAKSQPITLENGTNHWEQTFISGDINGDGKVSVADALLLQKCFMDKYDYLDEENLCKNALDVNFDGYFDSFDLVQIRQLVLNPEKADKQTWAVDILNTESEIPTFEEKCEKWNNGESFDKIITAYDEMSEYLKTFITDNDELQKYLDKYNETFFEENNLVLAPFIQERGNDILMEAGGTIKLSNCTHNDMTIDNGVFFFIGGNYNNDVGLYPVTNTKMLAQITLPKSQTNAETKIAYFDFQEGNFLSERRKTASYTDGTHEIVVTQELSWDINANIYIKNDDGSFTYITSVYPDSYFEDGELSTDDYTITFLDDSFIIDYRMNSDEWHKEEYSHDGDFITDEHYTK